MVPLDGDHGVNNPLFDVFHFDDIVSQWLLVHYKLTCNTLNPSSGSTLKDHGVNMSESLLHMYMPVRT